MEMEITFPGGARVDATFGPYIVRTDQPPQAGGEGSAPTPFATFLASLATCAGIYVLEFCRQRGLPTAGIRLIQRTHAADPRRSRHRHGGGRRSGDPGPRGLPREISSGARPRC